MLCAVLFGASVCCTAQGAEALTMFFRTPCVSVCLTLNTCWCVHDKTTTFVDFSLSMHWCC